MNNTHPMVSPSRAARLSAAGLALILAACAATPDKTAPSSPAPSDSSAASTAPATVPEDARVAIFVNHARLGHCAEVTKGLDEGIAVDSIDTLNQTALIAAVTHNSAECVHLLLERGANPEIADNAGWTPLIYAAYFSTDTAVMEDLLAHRAAIDARNGRGVTALYLASAMGHDGQVKYLLQRGADKSIATQSGYTPLRIAQVKGFASVIALLDPQAQPPAAGATQASAAH